MDENDLDGGSYNRYGNIVITKRPDIIENILNLPIEQEVKSRAQEIYYRLHDVNKNVKSRQKLQLIFYCIWMAYLELDCPQDTYPLADMIALPRKNIDKALSKFLEVGIVIIEPERMIKYYIRRINSFLIDAKFNEDLVTENVIEILKRVRRTEAGNEWVDNTPVKIVAVVSIYFYLNDIKRSKLIENTSLIEKTCYLSWACIRRYHEVLERYYNSEPDTQEEKITIPFLD
jgi:transcription initiation factor TFIIIB Brf1 subunit/transcription initiation factor TFIIB